MGASNHFHVCMEACSHGIDMYKLLLGKSPLCFNISLLLQPQFYSLIEQILANLSQVDHKGVKAWDITL